MKQFIEKLSQLNWDDLDEDTIKSSKLILLDTLGAYVGAIDKEGIRRLISDVAELGDEELLLNGAKLTLADVALITGAAVVALELDEGNQFSKGHPAAHCLPVLWILAQKDGYTMSGKEFLLNVVKSYEACSYFGRNASLHPEMHAHGTWGVLGATAAATFASDSTTDELYEALNTAATFALPTSWNAALEGAFIRNVYVGKALASGIQAQRLVKAGVHAPVNNISHVFGKLFGNSAGAEFHSQKILWDVKKNYFKNHAFCRYSHAPLEAFKEAIHLKKSGEEINRVDIYTYERAATLNRQEIINELSAKFSIPYALASWHITGISDESAFIDRYLKDEEISAFTQKVFVHHDTEMDRNYPKSMPVKVVLTLASGETITVEKDQASGGPTEKMSQEAIINKFIRLTANQLTDEQQQQVIDFILNLEEEKDAGAIYQLMRSSSSVTA
ncbi:MmgE/PrpD family protein [Bhargavaea ginsengi]|uniref:MmgE/PrpD family protein n=1 Tax=Bhargavaea ginsengi TaxID=426757 RepID=UPI003C71656F